MMDTVVEEYRRVLAHWKHPFSSGAGGPQHGVFWRHCTGPLNIQRDFRPCGDWTPPLPMPIRTWILPLSCTIWNIWARDWKRAILFQLVSLSAEALSRLSSEGPGARRPSELCQHRLDQRGKKPFPQHPSDTSGGTACLCPPRCFPAFPTAGTLFKRMADVCEELSLCFSTSSFHLF